MLLRGPEFGILWLFHTQSSHSSLSARINSNPALCSSTTRTNWNERLIREQKAQGRTKKLRLQFTDPVRTERSPSHGRPGFDAGPRALLDTAREQNEWRRLDAQLDSVSARPLESIVCTSQNGNNGMRDTDEEKQIFPYRDLKRLERKTKDSTYRGL